MALTAVALLAASCLDGGASNPPATTATSASPTTTAPPPTAPPPTAAPTTTRPGPGPGGIARLGVEDEPTTLNGFLPGGASATTALIAHLHGARVAGVDGVTLEPVPLLITELPTLDNGGLTINDDGTMTVRYQIRPEAQWSDGIPVTGSDFAFTYQVVMDPELHIVKTGYEDIDPGSIAVADKAFQFTMAAPTLQVGFLFDEIIPRHVVEGSDFTADWNDRLWPSAGPFVVERWVAGDHMSLVRNPNYWVTDPATGQRLPYLDGIEVVFFTEARALAGAFARGEVDIMSPSPTDDLALIEQVDALAGEGAQIGMAPAPSWEHLGFQLGEKRLESNPGSYNRFVEFRQAVAHAIDRQAIADAVFGGRVSPLSSYVEVFDPELAGVGWEQYPYDPERARRLIDELCARDDTDCGTSSPTVVFTAADNSVGRLVVASLLGEMLQAAGIAYEEQLEPSSLFFGETMLAGSYDVAGWAWTGPSFGLAGLVAIHNVWDPDTPPPAGTNYHRIGTPAVSGAGEPFDQGQSSVVDDATERFAEVRDEMNLTVDPDRLASLVAEGEALLADNAWIVPLYQRVDVGAAWPDRIAGFVHNPSVGGDTWNAGFWYSLVRDG